MACCLMAPSHYLNQCWPNFDVTQYHRGLMCQRPHKTGLLLDGTKPLPEPMLTKFWCHTVSPGTNVSQTTQHWLVAWWHQAITWTNADQILMSYSITGDQCVKDHTTLACCLMAPSHYLNQCWPNFDVIQYHRGPMCQRPHNTDLLLDGTKPLPEPMLTKFWCHTVSPGTNVSKTTQHWLVAWWHQAITWTNADQILMSYSITGDQCVKDHTTLACCLMAPSHYMNQCWPNFDVIQYHRGPMCQRPHKTGLLLDGTKPLPEPMLIKIWCHTISPGLMSQRQDKDKHYNNSFL